LTLKREPTIIFRVLPLLVAGDADASETLPSLRERNRVRVRSAIVDSALELFSDRGFDDVSVAEVAHRAGVSPATVARYFPSKESILFPERDANVALLRAAIVARPRSESPMRALSATLLDWPEMTAATKQRLLLSRQAIARSTVLSGRALDLLREWRDGIAAALVERGGLGATDARSVATAVVALLDDAAARWADDEGTTDLRDEIRSSLDSLERARRRSR
jgi:AcrR family transcriptional regulator